VYHFGPASQTAQSGSRGDEAKSDRCLRGRGFSFTDILPAFVDPRARIERDRRRDYGEERFRLYGRVVRRLLVIVYTRRGAALRIISARKANAREGKRYAEGSSTI
jgi:uncharacterized protein